MLPFCPAIFHVCCTGFISHAVVPRQPEAGNVGESTTEQYTKSAKEAANFVTRGVGYLANAAKQAVVGDGLARESHNPAGEVAGTRWEARTHLLGVAPQGVPAQTQIYADQNRGVHVPAQSGRSYAGCSHTCVPVSHATQTFSWLATRGFAQDVLRCIPAVDRLSPNKQTLSKQVGSSPSNMRVSPRPRTAGLCYNPAAALILERINPVNGRASAIVRPTFCSFRYSGVRATSSRRLPRSTACGSTSAARRTTTRGT